MMLTVAEGGSGRSVGQAGTCVPSLLNFCLLSGEDSSGGAS